MAKTATLFMSSNYVQTAIKYFFVGPNRSQNGLFLAFHEEHSYNRWRSLYERPIHFFSFIVLQPIVAKNYK